jgi:hypothetical protein
MRCCECKKYGTAACPDQDADRWDEACEDFEESNDE